MACQQRASADEGGAGDEEGDKRTKRLRKVKIRYMQTDDDARGTKRRGSPMSPNRAPKQPHRVDPWPAKDRPPPSPTSARPGPVRRSARIRNLPKISYDERSDVEIYSINRDQSHSAPTINLYRKMLSDYKKMMKSL